MTVPPKSHLDRFTIWKWYSRSLWIVLIVIIYGTVTIWMLAQAMLPLQKEFAAQCKPIPTPQSVPWSVMQYALIPSHWGAPLASYLNASYAPQLATISKGCPIPAGSINIGIKPYIANVP
jgi:hypothetical protein